MARKFSFVITADYNPALKAIRSVNRELRRINQPLRDIASATRAFGRESGLKDMISAFKGTAEAAGEVAGKIASILTPLVAVTGFGSVAGIVEMGTHWGDLARQIELVKYQTGISSGAIQQWIGGGKLFGITTQTMTNTLVNFSSALQDAVYGRNPGLYNTLGLMGIQNVHERLGEPDKVLEEFADKLQNLTPLARHTAVMQANLGGIEAMLMDGSAGFHRALDAQKKYGYDRSDDEVKAGKEFAFSMFEANTAVSGLANKIGVDLVPVMKPLVDQFKDWVLVNRDLISQNVTEFFAELTDTLKNINFKDILDGVKEFLHGLKEVVKFLGGWRNAIIALMAVMAAPLIAAVLNLTLAIGGFVATITLAAPEVVALVAALWALYEIKQKLFNLDGSRPGNSLSDSIDGWKKKLGLADNSWVGGATPVSGGMSLAPSNGFVLPGGMSYAQNMGTTPMSVPGGQTLDLVNPDVNQIVSGLAGVPALAGGAGAMKGSLDVNMNMGNLPVGTTASVKAKGGVTPSVNIYHSEALSSGISP